ncbi:MAG TPA: outer membrane beta-barrel protein [Candidatus Sulfotelmatobacter sp.]|jgi:hypothetical protein
MNIKAKLYAILTAGALPFAFGFVFLFAPAKRCEAQSQRGDLSAVAASDGSQPNALVHDGGAPNTPVAPRSGTSTPDPEISPAVAKKFAALEAEIEELKAELKGRAVVQPASPVIEESTATTSPIPSATFAAPSESAVQPAVSAAQEAKAGLSTPPEKVEPTAPFAYADWSWLNGSPHTKDAVWDSKFFTPEIRFDTDYIYSFNHPRDDSLGGSTEIFRSNEIQVEQISFGGDFHWQNVRGRVLTMGGMFGVTTPRNDPSVGRGQWDLRGAYKYFAEAYGGYHFNVNHGLNVDAGIFVSYIGLFSYYNFDNWAYQPSFVSSNTPWFFNGLRIQWFPTDKLKIEPWIINGWQSYGRIGNRPGLGGQILYRPKQWISMVFNNYGMGEDTLNASDPGGGRSRIHTDDSIEVKYYDHPERFVDKMAFSLTGDLGCEYGGGVSCHKNEPIVGVKGGPKQSFAGWMAYNRWWFKHDLYAITLGGGVLDNPGRYLTLLPPINGADAVSGSPYFPSAPGLPFKAWDTSASFYYMPKQYISFLWEFGYRHANQPYWSGPGGITPPGGNNGSPGEFVCMDNTPSTTAAGCGNNGGLWTPNLVRDEPSFRTAIMVKF